MSADPCKPETGRRVWGKLKIIKTSHGPFQPPLWAVLVVCRAVEEHDPHRAGGPRRLTGGLLPPPPPRSALPPAPSRPGSETVPSRWAGGGGRARPQPAEQASRPPVVLTSLLSAAFPRVWLHPGWVGGKDLGLRRSWRPQVVGGGGSPLGLQPRGHTGRGGDTGPRDTMTRSRRSHPGGEGRRHQPLRQLPPSAKGWESAAHAGLGTPPGLAVPPNPALGLSLPAPLWLFLSDLRGGRCSPGRRVALPCPGDRAGGAQLRHKGRTERGGRGGRGGSWPGGPYPAGNSWGCSCGSWTRLLAGPGTLIKSQVSIEKLYCQEGL